MAPMQSLQHAKGPEDNWTGLRDRAERRRLQTRLNDDARLPSLDNSSTIKSIRAMTWWRHAEHPILSPVLLHRLTSPFPLSRDHLIPLIEYNVYRASLTNIYILSLFSLLRNPSCMAILQPAPPLFPVHEDNNNNDNQNAAAAGVSTRSNNNDNIRNVPDSLLPTELQRTTPHELWIDILPSPRMRDNAIAAVREGRLVEDGICADVLRGMCGGVKKTGKRLQPLEEEDVEEEEQRRLRQGEEEEGPEARLIVWTNPWEAGGWEVTEGFVRKYGYLLKGCEDILGATNRYRRERGDDPLVWEVE
ncbi:hypothetical protein M406DRAFT_352548 [Cryphonectria parasitica EP155]|uniref:Uncharacterized protein n=1 Tax=Cryphonectria parasitica (strain ATCC 38755 / EP155) TaxID=660469 RepID=A0A9P4XZQ9_CRYP1|nr:uncharacterized protein M406DRAFT_352548 [Cryphonectria parasitica EP155]KAF3763906.1 hypothetical protein M406DRAFT_352548 [Cryphonectria parasitica EP155]